MLDTYFTRYVIKIIKESNKDSNFSSITFIFSAHFFSLYYYINVSVNTILNQQEFIFYDKISIKNSIERFYEF